AAGDQGEPRAGGEGEACGPADTTESADRDGLQVGARHSTTCRAVVLEGGEQEGSGVLVEVGAREPLGDEVGEGAGGRSLRGLPWRRRVRCGVGGYGHDGAPVETMSCEVRGRTGRRRRLSGRGRAGTAGRLSGRGVVRCG